MNRSLPVFAAVTLALAAPVLHAETAALKLVPTKCPAGTQGKSYAGCTVTAAGGAAPYAFSIDETKKYPSLPEGMSLDRATGKITATQIGGQGTYQPRIIVTDHAGARASRQVAFAVSGANKFLADIFPSTSIFHHRVDAATTGLPVDASPAAPILADYRPAPIKAYFGNATNNSFPNGSPVFSVPADQPEVPVTTGGTEHYQHYFTAGPIPGNAPIQGTSHSDGDRHVLIYRAAGQGKPPALYEMWQGVQTGDGWTDASNALWPNVRRNALTPQGKGTSDAAGLPVAPLLANADEVIGAGTPSAPKGTVRHPIRFTVHFMLDYWVWPATQTASGAVETCTAANGGTIPIDTQISQVAAPKSCTWSGPAGEIYRLKASVKTPDCAASSPQAAILIQGFRNYGIIMADNGGTGGSNGAIDGTPDARWHDGDLQCLESLTLADFEPIDVSSLIVSNDSGATKK